MKNRSFLEISFYLFFILISIIFSLIGHQLVIISISYPPLIILIGIYAMFFLGVFDTIEKNSSLKYWQIKRDYNSKKICKFLYTLGSLFYSNLLIAFTSIFFLYKLIPIPNGDKTLLIFAATTVVILIRLFVYSNVDIAKEIGKGFRYAMFPFGFTLFF